MNDLYWGKKNLLSEKNSHFSVSYATQREEYVLFSGKLRTWLLKVFVEHPPRLRDPLQALFHGLDVHVWAVALRELEVTLAPAVIVLAVELSLSVAGDVAEGSLHKTFSQVNWEDQLQTYKSRLSSGRGVLLEVQR